METPYPRITFFVYIFSNLMTSTAVIVGIIQFNKTQELNQYLETQRFNQESSRDFQNKLWEEQISVYNTIARKASALITEDSLEFKVALNEFLVFYYSILLPGPDEAVELALKNFRDYLHIYSQGRGAIDDLKIKVMYLVSVCQKSLLYERERLMSNIFLNEKQE